MDSEAPDVVFVFSMVGYGIHAYIEAVRYIFISKICFCVLMEQIVGSCCEVKINNDIVVSPVDMFSKVMFLLIRTRCFNFLQDLKVFFFISVRITSVTVIG